MNVQIVNGFFYLTKHCGTYTYYMLQIQAYTYSFQSQFYISFEYDYIFGCYLTLFKSIILSGRFLHTGTYKALNFLQGSHHCIYEV